MKTTHKVWIDDYSSFRVKLVDGEPVSVWEVRLVWFANNNNGINKMMSERINRAISAAKADLKEHGTHHDT